MSCSWFFLIKQVAVTFNHALSPTPQTIRTVVGSLINTALSNILAFVGASTLLIMTDVKLALVIFIAIPLMILPSILLGGKIRTLSASIQNRTALMNHYIGDTLSNIKTVHAFNQQQQHKHEFDNYAENVFSTSKKLSKRISLYILSIFSITSCCIVTMFWFGWRAIDAGVLSFGELASFIYFSYIVFGSINGWTLIISDIQTAAGATDRIMNLFKVPNTIVAPESSNILEIPLKSHLSIDNVHFFYPTSARRPALSNLSLNIKCGETVAVVGPSGAGKSTLFELLLRFYDPQQGSITLDNVNIKDLCPTLLREQCAIVPQQPTLFSKTILQNINYGYPEATIEETMQAAKDACISDFIENELRYGYHTLLGTAGVHLSGGQRQRIAIARAFLTKPKILLLDEATSALDAKSEAKVKEAILALMKGRTTLVIAHRLATVMNADRIIVLDKGKLIAQGTHAQLLKSCPLYNNLAKLQF